MDSADHHPICTGCGTQYFESKERCPVCEDPRQFIPPEGQQWQTMGEMRRDHRNVFKQDSANEHIWSIYTEPKFAIGQRCILIETPSGTVIWDLVSFIDQKTIDFVKSKCKDGRLSAIVISHPHFYTTNSVWAEVFDCPVYVASDDLEWLFTRPKSPDNLRVLQDVETEILPGVKAIKCGGHFPGSMVLHWEKQLFHSDTIFAVASSRNPPAHVNDQTHTWSFLWSIPNSIPLDPKTIYTIWSRLKPLEFEATFGNILPGDVKGKDLKQRLLTSAKMQVRHMGWEGKEEGGLILNEKI